MITGKKDIYHFLIVDDESDIRSIVSEWIKAKYPHANVVHATNGFEAFQKISMQKFNMVITDIKMPKVDGIGLLQTMYKVPKEFIPDHIIIISGHVTPSALPEELQSFSFFPKPLKKENLMEYIEKIIETRVKDSDEQKSKFDVAIINALIEATTKYFSAKHGTTLEKLATNIAKPDRITGDVSALVDFSSVNYICSFTLGFSESLFLPLANSELKKNSKNIVLEHHDLIKKMCLDILQEGKLLMDDRGENMIFGKPKVTIGKNHTATHLFEGPCIQVEFKTPQGKMCFEIIMKFKSKNPLDKK